MYLNTNYQTSSARPLLNYIKKDHPLRNTAGRKITQRERESFIQKSERHQFEREIQLSPDPEAEVTQQEMEREARRYLQRFTRERQSVRAVYAYHNDNGIPHVHAALTGERRDLFMDAQKLEQDRQQLTQRLEYGLQLEQRQQQRQRQEQRQEQTLEQTQKQQPEQKQGVRQEQTQEPTPEWDFRQRLQRERQQRQEQTQQQEQELEQRIEQAYDLHPQLQQEQEQEQEQKQELRQEQTQSQSQDIDWW